MLQKTWDWEESCNGFNQRIVRVAGHKLILSFIQFLDKQVWPTQGSRMQMHNTLFTSAFASNFENNFTMMCYFVLADCIKSEFKKKKPLKLVFVRWKYLKKKKSSLHMTTFTRQSIHTQFPERDPRDNRALSNNVIKRTKHFVKDFHNFCKYSSPV